ncbi:hypothetical protein [Streptomyces sp. NBC_01481]|uniref:hypothetical protein n=1 Tax=Streptomyces sp. NBC_01481 TaxID=2975869 RepID=UPI00224EC2C4|nr:hypothetical protein [Streptomyces sp. NBC_01481]MCX4587714.1 hypothetical protein [Streptomyces sp. NBC_01481]
MSTAYHFPPRLQAVQLHGVRAQYEQLCRSLPWSVDPTPGWTYEEKSTMGPATRTVSFADSPGYTPEQVTLERQFRRRLLRLSAAVITDPWWTSVPSGEQVDARMAR